MPSASYTLRRTLWFLWRWETGMGGRSGRRGLAISKAAARWAARNRIRANHSPT